MHLRVVSKGTFGSGSRDTRGKGAIAVKEDVQCNMLYMRSRKKQKKKLFALLLAHSGRINNVTVKC